jgi:hypothetical protein
MVSFRLRVAQEADVRNVSPLPDRRNWHRLSSGTSAWSSFERKFLAPLGNTPKPDGVSGSQICTPNGARHARRLLRVEVIVDEDVPPIGEALSICSCMALVLTPFRHVRVDIVAVVEDPARAGDAYRGATRSLMAPVGIARSASEKVPWLWTS